MSLFWRLKCWEWRRKGGKFEEKRSWLQWEPRPSYFDTFFTVLSWHLIVSLIFKRFIKPCLNDSRNDTNEDKLQLQTSQVEYVWLAQWDNHQTSKPVMVSVVGVIPTGCNFIFCQNFLNLLDINSGFKCKSDLVGKQIDLITVQCKVVLGN